MNDVDLVLKMVEVWNAEDDEDEIEAMDRILVFVRENDEYEEMVQLKAALATALAQKRATDNENLQLRAQLDPDGPAQPLVSIEPMQTGTGPGFAKSAMAVVTAAGSTSADVIAELQAEIKLLEAQRATLQAHNVELMGEVVLLESKK